MAGLRNETTNKVISALKANNGKIKQSELVNQLQDNYKDRHNCNVSVCRILVRLEKEGVIKREDIPNETHGSIDMKLIELM